MLFIDIKPAVQVKNEPKKDSDWPSSISCLTWIEPSMVTINPVTKNMFIPILNTPIIIMVTNNSREL